jgi:hypothetical protein
VRPDGGSITRVEPRSGCKGLQAEVRITSADGRRRGVVVALTAVHTVAFDGKADLSLDGELEPIASPTLVLPPRPATAFLFRGPADRP